MSRIIEEVYETARDLHKCGVMDKKRMREYDALYRAYHVPAFTPEKVKKLREQLDVSQTVLAALINISASTVRAWEAGTKKPGGAACLLMDLLSRKGIEAVL